MALYAKIKRSKIGGICKKKRCYANLEAPLKRRLPTIHIYNPHQTPLRGVYEYIQSLQTPPFEKEGLVVCLRLTPPAVSTIQIAILRYGVP